MTNNFLERFKRGMQATSAALGPGRYQAVGKTITCPHCGRDHFQAGHAQLNTAGATLLNLDWANRSATILTCTYCSRVIWFLTEPERVA